MKTSTFAQSYVNNSTCSAFFTVEKNGVLYPAYSNGLTNFAVVEDGKGNNLETLSSGEDNFVPHIDFPANGYILIGQGITEI